MRVKSGVDTQASPLANASQWSESSLIRFKNGWLEMIRGWANICETPVTGVARCIHHWHDNDGTPLIAIGTHNHLYVVDHLNVLHDITPLDITMALPVSSVAGSPFSLGMWTLDNFGERLIGCYFGQKLVIWQPDIITIAPALVIAASPPVSRGVLIVMPARIVMTYGSAPDDDLADPLLVRWSDQEDYTDWTVSTTNQAGSFKLSRGSFIVGGLQAGIQALLWTDLDLWIVQYIGFPLVFSFLQAGTQCGLIAQQAAVAFGGAIYWMSNSGFFQYSGQGITKLPCSVWDAVFRNIDVANQDKCVVGVDSLNSEIWYFFPSVNGATGEIDSYVKYNVLEKVWDYGPAAPGAPNQMSRTAWSDLAGTTVSIDLDGVLQGGENGFTADGVTITDCMVKSGFIDFSEGGEALFIDQFIPDFTWAGVDPEISVTLYFREYPSDDPTAIGPFTITPDTQFVTLRLPREITVGGTTITAYPALRAREAAIKIETVSGWWRWGAPRLRAVASGIEP